MSKTKGKAKLSAGQSKAVLRTVRREIGKNIEKKYWDYASGALNVTTTGTIGLLSVVPQTAGASTDSTRVGDRIMLKSARVRMTIDSPATASYLRVIFFRWWPVSTAAPIPAILDILLTSGVRKEYAWDGVGGKDFTILTDRTYAMPASAGGDGNTTRFVQFNFYPKKLTKRPVQFDAGSVHGNGHFAVLLLSDQATTGPSVNYHSRIVFTDA